MYGNSQNNTEFTIDIICPELVTPEVENDLKNPSGVILTFDTTFVQQNYLLDEEDSEEENLEDNHMNNFSYSV